MKKKTLLWICLFSLLLCFTLPFTTAAANNKKPYFPKMITYSAGGTLLCMDRGNGKIRIDKGNALHLDGYRIGLIDDSRKMTVSDLKSSKPDIVSVSTYKSSYNGVEGTYLEFTYKDPGSANVTFKVKAGGKTYSYKVNVKVVKYANPLKKITVGSKNITSKFKKCSLTTLGTMSGKLNITTKPGWNVENVWIYDAKGNVVKDIKSNGQKINLKKMYSVTIYLRNEKSNMSQFLYGYVGFKEA